MAETLNFPITPEQWRIQQRDSKRAVHRNYWELRTVCWREVAPLRAAQIIDMGKKLITSQEELNHG